MIFIRIVNLERKKKELKEACEFTRVSTFDFRCVSVKPTTKPNFGVVYM